jgi:CTP:molybdopterin cytidylyltransferase MocA
VPAARFSALVLAGDRRRDDPLVAASGHGCKALLDIAGKPMLLRVLDALRSAQCIDSISLSGPERASVEASEALQEQIGAGRVTWFPPASTPSTSASAVLRQLPPAQPVLLTTADHPLLLAEYVDFFCTAALSSDADAVVGLAPYVRVREIFPGMKKTVMRFAAEEYCGCNLFAFLTPKGRELAELWRAVESSRKTPWRVVRLLGWTAVLRYRLGWLSLDQAMQLLSRRTGVKVRAISMPFGEAAVDVDSLADHALVQARILQRDGPG